MIQIESESGLSARALYVLWRVSDVLLSRVLNSLAPFVKTLSELLREWTLNIIFPSRELCVRHSATLSQSCLSLAD